MLKSSVNGLDLLMVLRMTGLEKLKVEHPPSTVMVLAAVKALKKPWDSKGSSLVAIKKYIDANYKV